MVYVAYKVAKKSSKRNSFICRLVAVFMVTDDCFFFFFNVWYVYAMLLRFCWWLTIVEPPKPLKRLYSIVDNSFKLLAIFC